MRGRTAAGSHDGKLANRSLGLRENDLLRSDRAFCRREKAQDKEEDMLLRS
jgi:hypothetical protein